MSAFVLHAAIRLSNKDNKGPSKHNRVSRFPIVG